MQAPTLSLEPLVEERRDADDPIQSVPPPGYGCYARVARTGEVHQPLSVELKDSPHGDFYFSIFKDSFYNDVSLPSCILSSPESMSRLLPRSPKLSCSDPSTNCDRAPVATHLPSDPRHNDLAESDSSENQRCICDAADYKSLEVGTWETPGHFMAQHGGTFSQAKDQAYGSNDTTGHVRGHMVTEKEAFDYRIHASRLDQSAHDDREDRRMLYVLNITARSVAALVALACSFCMYNYDATHTEHHLGHRYRLTPDWLSFLDKPSPSFFVAASIVHGLAALSYYSLCGSEKGREYFLTAGIIGGTGAGLLQGTSAQSILVGIMPMMTVVSLLFCTATNKAWTVFFSYGKLMIESSVDPESQARRRGQDISLQT